MKILLLVLALVAVSCVHRAPIVTAIVPEIVQAPQDDEKVIATPSRRTDIINLPSWLADGVQVCVENFPRPEQECLTVGELRAFAFARLRTH